jgi:hypothetical protein
MGMTQEAARRQLHQDEVNLSAEAFKNGDNPAKVAYDMAIARGYVPPKQRLDMQKEGQGASMPSGSGGKSGGLPSLPFVVIAPREQGDVRCPRYRQTTSLNSLGVFMATTLYQTGNALAVKLWAKKLFEEALKQTYFSRFMGSGTDNVVQSRTKPAKAPAIASPSACACS